jgi:plasmid maintenance system antidote protein VapI
MPDSRRHRDIEPAHPGEILAGIAIPATGKSKVEIASLLGHLAAIALRHPR